MRKFIALACVLVLCACTMDSGSKPQAAVSAPMLVASNAPVVTGSSTADVDCSGSYELAKITGSAEEMGGDILIQSRSGSTEVFRHGKSDGITSASVGPDGGLFLSLPKETLRLSIKDGKASGTLLFSDHGYAGYRVTASCHTLARQIAQTAGR